MRSPGSVFLILFECGAWRARLGFAHAVECAKNDGAYCCAKANLERPHRARIEEYVLSAARGAATTGKPVDLDAARARATKRGRGGLVVIDGGSRSGPGRATGKGSW